MHGKVAAASKIAIHLRISRKVRRPRCNGHNSKLSARSSSVNRHEVRGSQRITAPGSWRFVARLGERLDTWRLQSCYSGACYSLFSVITAAEILLEPDIALQASVVSFEFDAKHEHDKGVRQAIEAELQPWIVPISPPPLTNREPSQPWFSSPQ